MSSGLYMSLNPHKIAQQNLFCQLPIPASYFSCEAFLFHWWFLVLASPGATPQNVGSDPFNGLSESSVWSYDAGTQRLTGMYYFPESTLPLTLTMISQCNGSTLMEVSNTVSYLSNILIASSGSPPTYIFYHPNVGILLFASPSDPPGVQVVGSHQLNQTI